jgi:hypothetical protein
MADTVAQSLLVLGQKSAGFAREAEQRDDDRVISGGSLISVLGSFLVLVEVHGTQASLLSGGAVTPGDQR